MGERKGNPLFNSQRTFSDPEPNVFAIRFFAALDFTKYLSSCGVRLPYFTSLYGKYSDQVPRR